MVGKVKIKGSNPTALSLPYSPSVGPQTTVMTGDIFWLPRVWEIGSDLFHAELVGELLHFDFNLEGGFAVSGEILGLFGFALRCC